MLVARIHSKTLLAVVGLTFLFACEGSTVSDIETLANNEKIGDYGIAPRFEMKKNGFVIDGKYRILRGGTIQFFRLPESVWEDRLRKFKAAGFNTIDMYVAWNNHEPEEGKFDFSKPDVRKFLDLAKGLGLYVMLRPGPYFTNEYDGGGVPAWVLARTTKKTRAADGLINLRTNDPDYLALVERYQEENGSLAGEAIDIPLRAVKYEIEVQSRLVR